MHNLGISHSSVVHDNVNISRNQHYGFHHIRLPESITVLSSQDHIPHNSTMAFPQKQVKPLLSLFENDYLFIIGAAIGASALIIIFLLTVIAWRYYKMKVSRRQKTYCLNVEKLGRGCKKVFKCCSSGSAPNDSIVCLSVKPSTHNLMSDAHLLVPSSSSNPLNESVQFRGGRNFKERPLSEPVPEFYLTPPMTPPQHYLHDTDKSFQSSLPTSGVQLKVSTSDECASFSGVYHSMPNIEPERSDCNSLPAWDHCSLRPLSAADDMNNLFGSFSKKRKNRMHNDIAAAIALSKSRSSLLEKPLNHSDTECLVDSDTEVVYNERTAV